jgi:hypothetical protein
MPIESIGPIRQEPPDDALPIPLVVTAESPEETRRWQVLLASKKLNVLRGSAPAGGGVPVISIHVEHHDVWLSWVQPAANPAELRESLRERWKTCEMWLDQNGRLEQHVERHEAWGRMLHGLAELDYAMVTRPGNVRWIRFTTRDQAIDWRLKADIIAELVWRESAGETA